MLRVCWNEGLTICFKAVWQGLLGQKGACPTALVHRAVLCPVVGVLFGASKWFFLGGAS
jgi:hypothetical protein